MIIVLFCSIQCNLLSCKTWDIPLLENQAGIIEGGEVGLGWVGLLVL